MEHTNYNSIRFPNLPISLHKPDQIQKQSYQKTIIQRIIHSNCNETNTKQNNYHIQTSFNIFIYNIFWYNCLDWNWNYHILIVKSAFYASIALNTAINHQNYSSQSKVRCNSNNYISNQNIKISFMIIIWNKNNKNEIILW